MERWFETGPWSQMTRWWLQMTRWWNAQGGRTRSAVAVAGLFAVASMVNLVAASFNRSTTTGRIPAPIAANASAAASVPPLVVEAAPADAGKTWSVTKVWQGTGSRETEEFVVGEHWRVDWIFSPSQSGGLLQVFIYHADGRLLMNLAANSQKSGADTSFWAGAGKYFLKINSSGDWKLAVQDLR